MVNKREFLSLTNDEIKQIVTDMFSPKRITNIKKSKKYDEITCTIYTEWESFDDDGNKIVETIPDEIELQNPFDYGENAIWAQFQLTRDDYNKLKQFCFAKGIYGKSIEWMLDNPYIEEGDRKKEAKCPKNQPLNSTASSTR